MSQVTNTVSSADAPTKRKRGRPRKDDNQASPRSLISGIQGEGSGASKTTANIQSRGKDSVEDVNDDDQTNDEMVGQVVTGVLEYAFEAGYFLTVRIGDSNMCMRGIVFKDTCVVPVTPENDIAPNAKMYKRGDFPIPPMKPTPQAAVQTANNASLNPTENNGNQQQNLPSEIMTQKEDHCLLQKGQLNDQEQQESLSDDKERQEKLSVSLSNDKEEQEKLSLSNDKEQQQILSGRGEVTDEGSAKDGGLKDLLEPPLKLQKTEHLTGSITNEENVVTNGIAEDAAQIDVAANNTDVPKEAVNIPPEISFPVTDSSVVVSTVAEQDTCETSGFQISMENADFDDDESPEHLSDPNSPMATG